MNNLLAKIGLQVRKKLMAAMGVLVVSMAGQATAAVISFDPSPAILGPATYGTYFIDGDFHVEAFWFTNTGTASWGTAGGHYHMTTDGAHGNIERQHFNTSSQLQGFMIRRTDNQAFSVGSLDYRVAGNTSIQGFSPTDVQVLIADNVAPSGAVTDWFTAHSAGGITGLWQTLNLSGLGNVTQVFISSSASVDFDNIEVGAAVPTAVPAPASLALMGVGLLGFVAARRKPAKGKAA